MHVNAPKPITFFVRVANTLWKLITVSILIRVLDISAALASYGHWSTYYIKMRNFDTVKNLKNIITNNKTIITGVITSIIRNM